jgi:AcrR family transcriptional regulator
MNRRQQLMEAGIAIFAAKGYHRTKVSDIVRQAGVAQGTFYLYFDSKKNLFLTLLGEFFALIEQALTEADLTVEHAQSPADVARQIREAIFHILAVYRDNATLARIFLREAVGLEPDFAQAWEAFTDHIAAWGETYLDQAIERRLLPPQNSQVVAYCVVGMIERVAYHWLAQEAADDLNSLADAVARFELMGILGAPPPDVESVLTGEEVSP